MTIDTGFTNTSIFLPILITSHCLIFKGARVLYSSFSNYFLMWKCILLGLTVLWGKKTKNKNPNCIKLALHSKYYAVNLN